MEQAQPAMGGNDELPGFLISVPHVAIYDQCPS